MVVYPHWRGELEPCQNGASFVPGLSPLARGTLDLESNRRAIARFIPAGAGNSCSSYISTGNWPVYPRWRGELPRYFRRSWWNGGLSPLARGTRHALPPGHSSVRFIPAGAGNSAIFTFRIIVKTVYPRWRGELAGSAPTTGVFPGLSPLARGTLPRPMS